MLDILREHQSTLSALLHSQRELSTDGQGPGVRIIWQMYAAILEDAFTTINSLINFLSPETSSKGN